MASKWLQERWEVLLPTLAFLGCAQEEEIKHICEAELEVWRQRPSLKRAISLQKPLTETRNRIRETFALTDGNWWRNPKSGQKEHLALKYLNFSTEEWIEIQAPSEEKLRERRDHPLLLACPWDLLEKVEQLLQSKVWPELVVGIGLATGRGIVEILQTGHFRRKSAYSMLFAAPMTVYEVLCDPFEVATLVRVEAVLSAVERVRQFFGDHFQGLRRRDISQQCRPQIQEAAYKQVWTLVPLRPGERNVYKSLAHGVYPQLAVWLYCPASVDPLVYMATIQQHCKFLEATSAEVRATLAQASLYGEYVVLDGEGAIDDRRGIHLNEPEVEVLEVFQQEEVPWQEEGVEEEQLTPVMGDPSRDDQAFIEKEEGQRDGGEDCAHVGRGEEPEVVKETAPTARAEEVSVVGGAGTKIWVETSQERQSIERGHQKEAKQKNQTQKARTMEWLGYRLKWFVYEMADYVVEDDEEAMRARCEAEMDAWRDYCDQMKIHSFQEMVMQTRVALRTSLPAPQNEWWNPETEEWEHIGLKYLRCTEAEWEQMRWIWLDRRLLLPDPDQIVSRAMGLLCTGMMEAAAWPQLVNGIAVLTGQGLRCILKDADFSLKTSFSLLCRDTGQHSPLFAKPFELPTLGRADLVVEAWERVRELVDCEQMENGELQQRYGRSVQETASKYFSDLVPVGEEDVFTLLHQSVYPCLAIHYYCPPCTETVDYLASICQDPLLLADPSPGEHWACAAVCGYLEYRIADERKGIWLEWSKEVERCAHHAMVEVEFEEEEIADLDDIRQEMGFDLASVVMTDRGEDEDAAASEAASGTLKLSITLQNQGLSPTLYEFIRLGLEHLSGSVAEFVSVCLREEMLTGLKLQQPFLMMLSSELRACDHPQATYELSRRTIIRVIRYNESISNPVLRWYLNEDVLFQIIQKSRSDIRWCLDAYQEEIDRHHQRFHLTAAGNEKPVPVTEVIQLPDDPQMFQEDVLSR
jgi:hypothetical protein